MAPGADGWVTYQIELLIRRGGLSVTVSGSENSVQIAIKRDTSIVLSVGRPGWFAKVPISNLGRVTMFGPDTEMFSPMAWLSDQAHVALLAALPLRDGSCLEIVRNATTWTGPPVDLGADPNDVIDALTAVATSLPPGASDEPKVSGPLPAALEPLRQLAPSWAISDDAERSARVSKAHTRTLLTLWSMVGPVLSEVDAFITTAEPSRVGDAAVLGDLAQAALEARNRLSQRGVVVS